MKWHESFSYNTLRDNPTRDSTGTRALTCTKLETCDLEHDESICACMHLNRPAYAVRIASGQ